MQLLREFANEPLIGVILQEMSIMYAEPKVTFDNGSIARFDSNLQDTKPNRNKRLYGDDVLSEAINSGPVKEKLRTRTMYGEANHPFVADLARQMIIDNARVSHITTALAVPNQGVVRGTIETAATSCGRDMRGLIVENKSTVAFSMRGMGGVRKVPNRDLVEVTKPLALFAYDWVTFPSHEGAYMDTGAVVREGCVPITTRSATEYATSQSHNVRALTEQFELENATYMLDETQMNMIIKSSQAIVKVFLEEDIRAEFRRAALFL